MKNTYFHIGQTLDKYYDNKRYLLNNDILKIIN